MRLVVAVDCCSRLTVWPQVSHILAGNYACHGNQEIPKAFFTALLHALRAEGNPILPTGYLLAFIWKELENVKFTSDIRFSFARQFFNPLLLLTGGLNRFNKFV